MTETLQPAPIQPPVKKPISIISWIALGLAIVGFITAVIPFVSFIAWIFTLPAFVLAIIGLAQKGKSKVVPAIALPLSVVAFIIAIVVSITTAAVLGSTSSSIDTSTATGGNTAPKNGAAAGTRENPAPIGSKIDVKPLAGVDSYTVVINTVTLNANDAIASANMFNKAAPAGQQYLMANVTYTYTGKETGRPGSDVSIDFVSAAGTTHKTYDSLTVAPNALNSVNELYPGASATGNIAILVPSADIEKGTLAVSDFFGTKKFFVKVV